MGAVGPGPAAARSTSSYPHAADPLSIRKLVVLGVGLIGGSAALAARRAGIVEQIVGIGRSAPNLDAALTRGILDKALTLSDDWPAELHDADVVLLAAPVAQYPALLDALAPAIGRRTIVTDAGSTKTDVVIAARAHLGAALPRFVPGHPIAGSEHSGANAAVAGLFDGRNVILTPLPETDAEAVARIATLWQQCGARVATLEPAEHDAIFAAVSHMPHLAAFAFVAELARRANAGELFAHAGSGFRDFTRIAGGSPEMWRDIMLANRIPLLRELDAHCAALESVRTMLESGDGTALAQVFAAARDARMAWGRERQQADPERSADRLDDEA